MSWNVSVATSDGEYEQPPTGPQAAVLTRIVDIGTHTDNSPLYGEQTRHQVVFMWELAETMSDGKPYTIQSFYTLSLHEKANLRKMLESWRGQPISGEVDITATLGKPCLLNIGTTDSGKSKVVGVSRLPKGMTAPEPVGKLMVFRTDEPDWDVFNELSQFHQNKIESSAEWPGMKSHAQMAAERVAESDAAAMAGHDDFDDDVPF